MTALLPWGGVPLDATACYTHFCASGASDSGKTATFRFLLQAIAMQMGRGRSVRVAIVDAKNDMHALVPGICDRLGIPRDRIASLHPFQSTDAWDLAREITDTETGLDVAASFIPQVDARNDQFFLDGAQNLIASTFTALDIRTGGSKRWDLRDVCLAMRSHESLETLLRSTDATSHVARAFLTPSPMSQGLVAELRNHFQRLEPVAARWSTKSARRITLSQFFRGEQFLLLGATRQHRQVLLPMLRIILDRLTNMALATQVDQRDPLPRQNWFFFDELAALTHEEGNKQGGPAVAPVRSLLTTGRTSGVCCAIAFQDIGFLEADFGPELADAICSAPENHAFLASNSGRLRAWQSRVASDEVTIRREETQSGHSWQPGDERRSGQWVPNVSYHTTEQERPGLPTKMLAEMQRGSRDHGFSGYYRARGISKPWFHHYQANALASSLIPPVQLPELQHGSGVLHPWNDTDRSRLSLSSIPKSVSGKRPRWGVRGRG